MTVLITLSGVGSSTGPTFDLYASPDGITFTTIVLGVNKTALEAGYTATVPNGTTKIKVTSVGACTNSYVATIGVMPTTTTTTTATPTTTTTTTIVNYSFSLTSGTVGCVGGSITFATTGPVTVYSNSPTLTTGVLLYTTPALTTLVSYSAVKSGTTIYELNAGSIDIISTLGGAC